MGVLRLSEEGSIRLLGTWRPAVTAQGSVV